MASQQVDGVAESIRELLTSYNELNAAVIDEFEDDEPSALEFMRYVSANRPFVIRKGAADWTAVKEWDPVYLQEVMGDSPVNVAITPAGNADSVIKNEHGDLMFVKPYETPEPFSKLLDEVREQELRFQQDGVREGPVRYGQTQNDNLRNEYATLFSDVPTSIPFARIALQKTPDAINFWLGNSLSTTAMHKDPYQNIYVQVLGRKHFTLLPPIAAPCVAEQDVPRYTYERDCKREAKEAGAEITADELKPVIDDPDPEGPGSRVPCVTWNPDEADQWPGTPFSALAQPLRVTLEPGDMLYLPALWYHRVAQSCGDEGICVAVNYWYDMDFAGSFWSMASFVRDVSNAVTKSAPEPKSPSS